MSGWLPDRPFSGLKEAHIRVERGWSSNTQPIMAKSYDLFALLVAHVYMGTDRLTLGFFSKKRIPRLALDVGKSLLWSMVALVALFSSGSEVQEEWD